MFLCLLWAVKRTQTNKGKVTWETLGERLFERYIDIKTKGRDVFKKEGYKRRN